MLDFDFGPFVIAERQDIELAHLPFKLLAFAYQCFGAAGGIFQRLPGGPPGAPGNGKLLRFGGQTGMAVEQRALRVGAQQRLVGMLTVDVRRGTRRLRAVAGRLPASR